MTKPSAAAAAAIKPAAAAADDEEHDALASVHASLQEQNAYEGQVLRQATHQLAPTLTASLGFPDLVSLVSPISIGSSSSGGGRRSGCTEADLPVLHAVLAATRRKIKERLLLLVQGENHSADDDLLHMKEQILLRLLSTARAGPTSSFPVRPAEERTAEHARSRRIIQQQQLKDGASTTATATTTQQKQQRQASNIAAVASEGTPRMQMQQQKQQQQRTRVPMMKRKRMDDPDTAASAITAAQATMVLTEQQRAELIELREERHRRKQDRRKQQQQVHDDSSSDEDEAEAIALDKEATRVVAVDDGSERSDLEVLSIGKQEDDDSKTRQNVIDDAEGPTTAEPEAPATAVISCPLCQANVPLDGGSDVDAVLAQHMSYLCEKNDASARCRRLSRRSTRGVTVSYAEEEPNDDDAVLPPRAFRAASTASSRSKPSALRSNEATKKKSRGGGKQGAPSNTPIAIKAQAHIDDMDEWAYEDRVDDWIEHGLGRMKIMKERDDGEALPGSEEYDGGLLIPEWMNDRLFGYQREGLKWMWELHQRQAGGIIGDEMGLGKTVQVAAFLGAAAASRKLKAVLIVAPATILQHWLTELALWAPGLRRVLIHKSGDEVNGFTRSISSQFLRKLATWLQQARANRVNEPIDDEDWKTLEPHSFCGTGYAVVTTYENLRRNSEIYVAHEWSYVVLDEAQKIRNPDADVTLACKRIRTPHRLAMSGTPIQNDLRELWSLFDFVFPGRLGTLPAFEQEFAVPIKRGGYSNASPMQVQLAYRCAITLRDLIEPFLLRRLKKDVKEVSRMPGKTEHVLFCRLSQRQRAMYEAYLQSDDVSRVLKGNNQLLAAVTMLRKIANHPDLVCDPSESSFVSFVKNRGSIQTTVRDSSDSDDTEDIAEEETMLERSGKLEVLAKILPLWKKQGHRVLIFCQWRKMLNIIERFIMWNGWKFGRLDGNTNIASRQRLVDSFNSDESYFCMLCTTRTGGVGLNLIGANRCILYDPDWNPSGDAQARERAWRFGQEKEVTIYRLITAGTIEEKIYQRQIFKTALSNKVLQDPKQRRLFSQRDLRDLFTLTADTGSVRSGADGITETSKVTRGVGVVDGVVDLSDENDDNEATLKKVMRSKGLAGIFDHHSVEPDHKRKTTTVREMEEQAKRVAKEAVNALKQSVASHDPFAPTWTGSDETKPGRFGSSRPTVSFRTLEHNPPAAAALAAGHVSSFSLLESLRQRNSAIESGGKSDPPDEATQQYTHLLGRLKEFVQRRQPSTEEILMEFENVPDSDVAIFRRLLKSVATIDNGTWSLIDAYRE